MVVARSKSLFAYGKDYNSEDYEKILLLFLESAFSQLSVREQNLMKLRLVDRLSYDEVAKEKFGVTIPRVQQIEAKAIRKIRSFNGQSER